MKLSLLINSYNHRAFIRPCLESVWTQTRLAEEVILYDDGSTDGTKEVVREFEDRLTFIDRPNYGRRAAFNQANAIHEAFCRSTGDVVLLLDGDDTLDSRRLESVARAFAEHPEAAAVQNNYRLIDEAGTAGATGPEYPSGEAITAAYYRHHRTNWFYPTSCLSFRREHLAKHLPIKEDGHWRVWSDVRLSRVIPLRGQTFRVHTLLDPLTHYRRHGGGDSTLNRKPFSIFWRNVQLHRDLAAYARREGYEPVHYVRSEEFWRLWARAALSIVGLRRIKTK